MGDQLSAKLVTRAGFLSYQGQVKTDPSLALMYKEITGKEPEAVKPDLCKQAVESPNCERMGGNTLRFVQDECPKEMSGLAKTCCKGREYSGLSEAWQGICVKYAKELLVGGVPGDESASEKGKAAKDQAEEPKSGKDQATDQAKKLLKGLFGK